MPYLDGDSRAQCRALTAERGLTLTLHCFYQVVASVRGEYHTFMNGKKCDCLKLVRRAVKVSKRLPVSASLWRCVFVCACMPVCVCTCLWLRLWMRLYPFVAQRNVLGMLPSVSDMLKLSEGSDKTLRAKLTARHPLMYPVCARVALWVRKHG